MTLALSIAYFSSSSAYSVRFLMNSNINPINLFWWTSMYAIMVCHSSISSKNKYGRNNKIDSIFQYRYSHINNSMEHNIHTIFDNPWSYLQIKWSVNYFNMYSIRSTRNVLVVFLGDDNYSKIKHGFIVYF